MVYDRLMPYCRMKSHRGCWMDIISWWLLGSTLRALIKYIDQISDADIDLMKFQTGCINIVYEFDTQLNVINKRN